MAQKGQKPVVASKTSEEIGAQKNSLPSASSASVREFIGGRAWKKLSISEKTRIKEARRAEKASGGQTKPAEISSAPPSVKQDPKDISPSKVDSKPTITSRDNEKETVNGQSEEKTVNFDLNKESLGAYSTETLAWAIELGIIEERQSLPSCWLIRLKRSKESQESIQKTLDEWTAFVRNMAIGWVGGTLVKRAEVMGDDNVELMLTLPVILDEEMGNSDFLVESSSSVLFEYPTLEYELKHRSTVATNLAIEILMNLNPPPIVIAVKRGDLVVLFENLPSPDILDADSISVNKSKLLLRKKVQDNGCDRCSLVTHSKSGCQAYWSTRKESQQTARFKQSLVNDSQAHFYCLGKPLDYQNKKL